MRDKVYFGWIKSIGGKIFPVKRFYLDNSGPDKKAYGGSEVIQQYELTENQAGMSLDVLSMEFPLI
jgi:hypothetical protein